MASIEDFSPNVSFSSPNLSSISMRLQNAYSKPLIQRCRDIEDTLKTASSKDIRNILPSLLENIFGFGSEPGWGLDVLSRSQNPHEFEAVLHLLAPEGTLMSFIYSLQTDIYLTYEFPYSCLPAPTRHMIEERNIPIFYVNKLQYQNYGKPVIFLSAFEFYLFHFSYVLVNPQWQSRLYNWSNMSDIVYPCLLDNYLRHFLPLNKKSLPKFPQTKLSPIRSPLVQQSPHAGSRPSPGSGTHPKTRSQLGLFKANLLTPQKPHTQGSPVSDKLETEIWWSETFLQVIAEFWLNQNSLESDRLLSNQSLTESLALESFSAGNNHVRLTRLFLKHVHTFVSTAAPETIPSQYQTPEISPLDEFKRSLLPQILQKKVYTFLKYNFERWPLDTSFRLMLELWLTYIQPWRYAETGHHRTRVERDSDHHVDDCWFAFIRDNFLFYSTLFQDLLQRVKRMNLTSVQNAYMVFRVSKVLSLPNLSQLMREVERMMYSSAFKTSHQDLGGTYIAPEISMVLRVQISELERSDFSYVNLFGPETILEVQEVLHMLSTAKATLQQATPEKSKKKKTGWASFLDFSSLFEDNVKVFGDLNAAEVKKLIAHLDMTSQNLSRIFSISPPDSIPSLHGGGDSHNMTADGSGLMNHTYTLSSPATPDCVQTDHGPQLTPLGRYQLMNGLRKFDIGFQGDPDLQPIRSFENATLVRALYRLSSSINKNYKTEIESLYNRQDIIGRMSQVFLSPPLPPNKAPSSPVLQQTYETLQTPRLSLRFLASYQTLLYLGIVYLILQFLWGVGPVGYILFLIVCILVYGLFRALLSKDEVKVD